MLNRCLPELIILLSMLLTGFAWTAVHARKGHIEVSLLLYSGRPDPRWKITAADQIKTLRSRLKDLPSAAAPTWPTLGWRGFQLVNEGVPDFPEEVRVFEGVIQIVTDDVSRYYKDAHGLEDWLRKQAKKRGLLKD